MDGEIKYAIAIPDAFTKMGPRMKEGWMYRSRGGVWDYQYSLQGVNKYGSKERAEAIAFEIVTKLPNLLGKLLVCRVRKGGTRWSRVDA